MTVDQRVGGYRLLRHLATGGMGEVWEVEPLARPGERLALKVLTSAADAGLSAQRKLLDEARIAVALQHRNIVRAVDVGIEDERMFLAFELLRGCTLAALCRAEARLPVPLVVGLGLQALAGLGFAHRLQTPGGLGRVVHRDIKPSNLFLTIDGTLKLIDFGIAVAEHVDRTETHTGAFHGSIRYASPEQVRNDAIDGRCDLYALGVVLHELLTGRPAYSQPNDAAVLNAILWNPLDPVRTVRDDVPEALDAAISWALRKFPADRPADASAFGAALLEALPAEDVWDESRIARWFESRALPFLNDAPENGTRHVARAVAEGPASLPAPTGTTESPADAVDTESVRSLVPRISGRRRAALISGAAAAAVAIAIAATAWIRSGSEVNDDAGVAGGASSLPSRTSQGDDRVASPTSSQGSDSASGAPRTGSAAAAAPEGSSEPVRPAGTAGDGARPGSVAVGVAPPTTPAKPTMSPQRRATADTPARRTRTAAKPARTAAPAEAAWLSIDSRPGWSQITLDGKTVGPSPIYRLRLLEGSHRIEALRPDGKRQQRVVEIPAGGHQKVVFEW